MLTVVLCVYVLNLKMRGKEGKSRGDFEKEREIQNFGSGASPKAGAFILAQKNT